MTLTVADIMTSHPVTLHRDSTLKDAHDITRNKGIRHLPVVDVNNNKLLAIVTQKAMMAKVISLVNLYGHEKLPEVEQQTNIMEIAVVDYDAVRANEKLADVASFFVDNKHGCLPVVDSEGLLQGIITSSDFVKLAAKLLSEQ
ncbi:HPP family protein [Aestuariibacter salexigens]|uniref:CBS domain-containing protein n=1 Tax=Aestuariibacter salexigens TaxID=226010 RepID=UPI00047B2A21|nr:CBS domain-containing protein [Aestuariibacter salexigens]